MSQADAGKSQVRNFTIKRYKHWLKRIKMLTAWAHYWASTIYMSSNMISMFILHENWYFMSGIVSHVILTCWKPCQFTKRQSPLSSPADPWCLFVCALSVHCRVEKLQQSVTESMNAKGGTLKPLDIHWEKFLSWSGWELAVGLSVLYLLKTCWNLNTSGVMCSSLRQWLCNETLQALF